MLEKDGYIKVTSNNREKIIELTEKGWKKGELFATFINQLVGPQ